MAELPKDNTRRQLGLFYCCGNEKSDEALG